MIWNQLIKTYDSGVYPICPISHTQILAHIGILLDDKSNFLAAAKIRQSIHAPCTAKSECRSSNIAPHLVHDKVSYVANVNPDRHEAYMEQLGKYVEDTGDDFCNIVLKYLQKDTINKDLESIIDVHKNPNPNLVITFGINGQSENTINPSWINYYLQSLPKDGICAITGQADYMPDAYPGNIRYPSDMAKLFLTKADKLDSMPQLRVGYIASQKIVHTLQFFGNPWENQGEIKEKDAVFAKAL